MTSGDVTSGDVTSRDMTSGDMTSQVVKWAGVAGGRRASFTRGTCTAAAWGRELGRAVEPVGVGTHGSHGLCSSRRVAGGARLDLDWEGAEEAGRRAKGAMGRGVCSNSTLAASLNSSTRAGNLRRITRPSAEAAKEPPPLTRRARVAVRAVHPPHREVPDRPAAASDRPGRAPPGRVRTGPRPGPDARGGSAALAGTCRKL